MSYAPDLQQNQPLSSRVRVIILAVSTLMLLWMARALPLQEIPINGDLFASFYPIRDFYASTLAAGHSFNWMPSLMGGFDLVGEGQLGAYHPAHWLLYR